MITIHGKFSESKIIQADGSVVDAYPYGIDYKKIDGRTGFYQCKDAINPDFPHLVIINWVFTE